MLRLTGLGIALAISISACTVTTAGKGTAVVIGGGQSGAPVAQALLNEGYAVRVMMRDPARARGLPAGVEVIAGDATKPATLAAGFAGADYVISTIGAACDPEKPFPAGGSPADVDYQGIANLAGAAKQAGVRQFVLMSALGAGNTDPKAPLNAICGKVLEWKGRGEDALRGSGVAYTIVRPGGLYPFPGQPACVGGKVGLALYPGAEVRGPGALCRADVALVMVDALGNKSAIGKTVNVVGDKKQAVEAWRSAWAGVPAD